MWGPQNISPLVAWLASDDAAGCNGQVFRVGGAQRVADEGLALGRPRPEREAGRPGTPPSSARPSRRSSPKGITKPETHGRHLRRRAVSADRRARAAGPHRLSREHEPQHHRRGGAAAASRGAAGMTDRSRCARAGSPRSPATGASCRSTRASCCAMSASICRDGAGATDLKRQRHLLEPRPTSSWP